jgi:hypothetical protein
LDYSVVSLRAHKKLRVQYKLDGFDGAWVDSGMNRRVSYPALRPGRYRFRVKAHIQGADWTEAGTAVEFDVPAAYYQTYWFATVCVVTIGMMVWSAWQFHVRQIRSPFDLVMAERTRMAREIHDTLLQSLVGLGLHLDNVSDGLQGHSSEELKDQVKSIRRQAEQGDCRIARDSKRHGRGPPAEYLLETAGERSHRGRDGGAAARLHPFAIRRHLHAAFGEPSGGGRGRWR